MVMAIVGPGLGGGVGVVVTEFFCCLVSKAPKKSRNCRSGRRSKGTEESGVPLESTFAVGGGGEAAVGSSARRALDFSTEVVQCR
ncbi:conserved hypothetical protein [Ricinus communis]|uniref:Uncharacterized protein n=1 Tax=Ricinus communis TaxID=3988 RepID=B9RLI4_RICCO|nr:conserved hypothetical protein [Ricinus communis]